MKPITITQAKNFKGINSMLDKNHKKSMSSAIKKINEAIQCRWKNIEKGDRVPSEIIIDCKDYPKLSEEIFNKYWKNGFVVELVPSIPIFSIRLKGEHDQLPNSPIIL